jgi:type II secretory pathway pseudopilin PulG
MSSIFNSVFPPRGGLSSIVVIGLVAIVSLYLFYIYSEQRRLDARLSVVSNQLSLALKTTQQSVEDLQGRLGAFESFGSGGGIQFPEGLQASLFPILFGGGGSPPITSISEVQVQNDDEDEEDFDEDDDENEEDDERLRKVLVGGEDLVEPDVDPPSTAFEEVDAETPVPAAPAAPVPVPAPIPLPAAGPAISEDLSALKIADLRKRLSDLGLDTKGTKDALLARLTIALSEST